MVEKMENYKIDFVIPWVNGGDLEWQKEKEKYWIKEGNTPFLDGNQASRFRDWDNLRYWFRGVEKFTHGLIRYILLLVGIFRNG
jgi:hypothetical protein